MQKELQMIKTLNQDFENRKVLIKKGLAARQSIEIYQARTVGPFDKKVRERSLEKGDLVLIVQRPMILSHKSKGKFESKWEGP